MHGLIGGVLLRLDPAGALEVLDTHADLTSAWNPWRSQMGLLPMVARALRQKLGLAPGARLAQVLETASPWSVLLAGIGAAGLLAGELVPVNRNLWNGDPALAGMFITTGPLLYVAMMLLALARAAGTVRLERVLAYLAIGTGALLALVGASTPWSRPPLFIIVLLAQAAVTVVLTAPIPSARLRPLQASWCVLGFAAAALTGAVAFQERLCALCMYRGGGPIAAVGEIVPLIILIAVAVATMIGISRGDVLDTVPTTLVVLAPWTLLTLSLFAFGSERMLATVLVLVLLVLMPAGFAWLLQRRRATALTVLFLLLAGGATFRVATNAFTGVIPGTAVFSTPTFGGICVPRADATDLAWGEIVVQPNAPMVVEQVALESATAMSMGEATLVPLRVVNGGYTVLGEARGYPPTAEDVRRSTVDWANRMPAAGAQLAAEQWYVLALQLHLGDPSMTAELHEVSVTYTQSGKRAALLTMGEIRVPPTGVGC